MVLCDFSWSAEPASSQFFLTEWCVIIAFPRTTHFMSFHDCKMAGVSRSFVMKDQVRLLPFAFLLLLSSLPSLQFLSADYSLSLLKIWPHGHLYWKGDRSQRTRLSHLLQNNRDLTGWGSVPIPSITPGRRHHWMTCEKWHLSLSQQQCWHSIPKVQPECYQMGQK